MSYYLGLAQLIGIHTLLGLSAYVLMLTGQLSLGQAGFFAIGAYCAGILTVIFELHIVPALLAGALFAAFFAFLVGFPALRVKGLMLVVATIAFGDFVRLFFFNLSWRVPRDGIHVGPDSTNGFREIRYFVANGWSPWEITLFVWTFVVLVMAALWWMDRSRAGAVLRAVGEDELAAQSVGISLTTVKVTAMTVGGFVAGIGGALYAHTATYVDHLTFTVLLATFAISYPILGGLSSVFGTLVAVIFIQGVLVEGLRFMGDWRSIVFGLLIVAAMNLKPSGLFDARTARVLRRAIGLGGGEKSRA
ncbi:MAG: branched-chain amino acid ABC transporter permease [Deltaproteobacteria bacterium]|nr:branched-chain amino acid ABC transporter permease [Deltaproteobacteria bacterium]